LAEERVDDEGGQRGHRKEESERERKREKERERERESQPLSLPRLW